VRPLEDFGSKGPSSILYLKFARGESFYRTLRPVPNKKGGKGATRAASRIGKAAGDGGQWLFGFCGKNKRRILDEN